MNLKYQIWSIDDVTPEGHDIPRYEYRLERDHLTKNHINAYLKRLDEDVHYLKHITLVDYDQPDPYGTPERIGSINGDEWFYVGDVIMQS